MKSSLNTVEASCSDIKRDLDKSPIANKKECDEMQRLGKQIYETITDVRNESKRTREQVGDIEKSVSAISEAGMFTSSARPKKSSERSAKGSSNSSP